MTAPLEKPLLEQERTKSIIGAFYAVYNALGFGFLEHVYAAVREKELSRRGHRVARSKSLLTTWVRSRPISGSISSWTTVLSSRSRRPSSSRRSPSGSCTTISAARVSRWVCYCTLAQNQRSGVSSTPGHTSTLAFGPRGVHPGLVRRFPPHPRPQCSPT